MIRFYFNKEEGGKLVRDKIPELTIAQKHDIKDRKLNKEDLAQAILGKFPEELAELKEELKEGNIEGEKKEIADIVSLLNAYIEARNFNKTEIEQVEKTKSDKKGSFIDGVVVEYVDLNPEGDDYEFWLNNFRKDPERYIEEEIDDK